MGSSNYLQIFGNDVNLMKMWLPIYTPENLHGTWKYSRKEKEKHRPKPPICGFHALIFGGAITHRIHGTGTFTYMSDFRPMGSVMGLWRLWHPFSARCWVHKGDAILVQLLDQGMPQNFYILRGGAGCPPQWLRFTNDSRRMPPRQKYGFYKALLRETNG